MKLVRENISFNRNVNPKNILGMGFFDEISIYDNSISLKYHDEEYIIYKHSGEIVRVKAPNISITYIANSDNYNDEELIQKAKDIILNYYNQYLKENISFKRDVNPKTVLGISELSPEKEKELMVIFVEKAKILSNDVSKALDGKIEPLEKRAKELGFKKLEDYWWDEEKEEPRELNDSEMERIEYGLYDIIMVHVRKYTQHKDTIDFISGTLLDAQINGAPWRTMLDLIASKLLNAPDAKYIK